MSQNLDWTAIGTFALAVATVALAIVTVFQDELKRLGRVDGIPAMQIKRNLSAFLM